MKETPHDIWELVGYGLWMVGILLFAVAAVRNGDPLSLVASLMFLVGIVAVMVPMVRAARDRER